MRCNTFYVTGSYDLNKSANALAQHGYLVNNYGKKVLHIQMQDKKEQDIFLFSLGCLVTWQAEKNDEQELMQLLEPFATDPLPQMESSSFEFTYGITTQIFANKEHNQDTIVLESAEPQLKLAISYGLAQSIKLESFEQRVQNAVDRNEYLIHELALHGKIPLSRREISKRMGEIFIARSLVNLNSDYLDSPEYFWEYAGLETYYLLIIKYLDLSKRVTALNQRLDVLQDLFNLLNDQLQHVHSSILEWTIIILILIEIIIMLIYYTV